MMVCLLCWVLPQLFTNVAPGLLFSENLGKIKQFAEPTLDGAPRDVFNLVYLALKPAYLDLGLAAMAFMGFLIGYAWLLLQFSSYFGNQTPLPVSKKALKAGLLTLRYGLGLACIGFGLFFLLQSLVPFLTFVLLPFMLAPVIAVHERRGVIRASWKALTMRFGPQQRFALFMQVCGIGALFYLGHLINSGLFLWLNEIDYRMPIPRHWFTFKVAGETLSVAFLLATFCEVILRAVLCAIMIATSTCLYLKLQKLKDYLAHTTQKQYV